MGNARVGPVGSTSGLTKNLSVLLVVGPMRGEPKRRPMRAGKSEGRIGAMTLGERRGRPNPGEQRRPVLARTSGGKHGRRIDAWRHVT